MIVPARFRCPPVPRQHLTMENRGQGNGGQGKPTRLSERQQEKVALIAEIASAETLHQMQLDRAAIEARVQGFVAEWRTLLTEEVEDGRQLLREVLEGPLRFTPDGKVYRFTGQVATGRLITEAVLPTLRASPGGRDGVDKVPGTSGSPRDIRDGLSERFP